MTRMRTLAVVLLGLSVAVLEAQSGKVSGTLVANGKKIPIQHVTAVTYEWNVGTTKPWMNALGPVARPVFEYNHDVVMRWGGEGLARRVGGRLLASD